MKRFIQILSFVIGLCFCLIVGLKITNNFNGFSYDTLDFIIVLVGIGFIFGFPMILSEMSSFKFWEFEWKREIADVKKSLRNYAILNFEGIVVKSTFPSEHMKIISFTQNGHGISIWFKNKPLYLVDPQKVFSRDLVKNR